MKSPEPSGRYLVTRAGGLDAVVLRSPALRFQFSDSAEDGIKRVG
jgi:hypothetical protein